LPSRNDWRLVRGKSGASKARRVAKADTEPSTSSASPSRRGLGRAGRVGVTAVDCALPKGNTLRGDWRGRRGGGPEGCVTAPLPRPRS
jgi:hypothetical protein